MSEEELNTQSYRLEASGHGIATFESYTLRYKGLHFIS